MKLAFIILALASIVYEANAQRTLVDEVVATVGDDAILWSDIEYQYEQAIMEGVKHSGNLREHIFEQMLIQKLFANQAKIDSLEVSEADVASQVDQRMNYFVQQVGGQDKLEEYFGKSFYHIKRDQTEMMKSQMLTQRMQAKITENVKITPSEIRRYYERMKQDSIPFVPAQYEIQQIVLYPEVEQAEIDRIKSKLRDFQKQVSEGRDFATLAVLYSEDPGSAARGGDLGWNTKASFVPEFSAVAFNLQEKGKVSKIVTTEFGYHIIQLIDRKGDRINCRHILMKPKISSESRKKANDFLDTITNLLIKEKLTFGEAATHFSMDKDTRGNKGVMINPQDGSTKFQLSEIPAEIAKALSTLKEGEYSKPFTMVDERKGKETVRIIMLKKRYEPHRANMQEDYFMLQNLMQEQKRKDALDAWIREKQKDLYVNIMPAWRDCNFQYPGWVK